MKKKLLVFLFCFSIALPEGFSQMRDDLQKEIDKIIFHDTEITFDKIPGFVIGIIYRDSVFIYSYGTTTKDSLKVPDRETIFEIGGLTKVFTASLVNLLVEEGVMNYDSTLNHYLPEDYQNDKTEKITINDLIIHTSGLPKLPLEFGIKENEPNNPYANYTKEDLLDFYKNYLPEEDRFGKYHYSTLNYALLEIAIEFATKESFEEVLREKIFDPLNMKNSCVTIDEIKKGQLTTGYTIAGIATPIWQFQSFAASEGVKSSADDLLKFLACNLGQSHPKLAANFSQTHVQVIETEFNKNAFMGKGWHIVKNKKYYDSVLHAGSTSGQRAFMGFVKETQTAVVLLSNSEYSTNGLGYLILRLINNNWKKRKR
jgi:serine-type D-Ala-D-Ala carboxypeptidase/endopeptidase